MNPPDSDQGTDTAAAETDDKKALDIEVEVASPSTCKRHVTVTVNREDIDRYFTEAIDELQPSAEVPGFRPGRAPRKLVESRFKDQVANQVKGSLLMDSMQQAMDDAEFSPISEPDFDFEAIELPDEGPLTFEFDVEVRPEFDLPEWKGLKLQRPAEEIDEARIDREMDRLLARYGTVKDRKGGVQDGDIVFADIVFAQGENELERHEDVKLVSRPKLSLPDGTIVGFHDVIRDAEPGDSRSTTFQVSDEASTESFRGQEIEANFHVKRVQYVEPPAITEAFLEEIGGFEDEQDVRDEVRKELERQLTYHQQQKLREEITTVLTQGADWDLPEDLVMRQAQRELQRSVMELRSAGFPDEMIQAHANELRQNSLGRTRRALHEHFILERIAEEEKVEAEPDDYDVEVAQIAYQSGESPRRVRARFEKRGQMDALRNQIVERKVIDRICEHAEITDVPLETKPDDTCAIDVAIAGREEDSEIPEASGGSDPGELKQPADYT